MENTPLTDQHSFHSLEQFREACFALTPIGPHTRLSPALDTIKDLTYPWAWNTKGEYAVQLVVPNNDISAKDTLVAAQLAFTLLGQDMIITNSPQGLGRWTLENCTPFSKRPPFSKLGQRYSKEQVSQIMRELKKIDTQNGWDFRDFLLDGAIKAAQMLKEIGVKRIVGTPAEEHIKVQTQALPLERAKKTMDLLYERHGFERMPIDLNSALGSRFYLYL